MRMDGRLFPRIGYFAVPPERIWGASALAMPSGKPLDSLSYNCRHPGKLGRNSPIHWIIFTTSSKLIPPWKT
jgi:hypothetical protein